MTAMRYYQTGRMNEYVVFVAPPGKADAADHDYGFVDEDAAGTDGTRVPCDFEVMGADDARRAGGEAGEDLARVVIRATTEATTAKRLRRTLDSTAWDIVKAPYRPDEAFMALTVRRST